jgi:hypothetical protein
VGYDEDVNLFKNNITYLAVIFITAFGEDIVWSNHTDWFIELDELGDRFEELDSVISAVDRIDFIVFRYCVFAIAGDGKPKYFVVLLGDLEWTDKLHSAVVTGLMKCCLESQDRDPYFVVID